MIKLYYIKENIFFKNCKNLFHKYIYIILGIILLKYFYKLSKNTYLYINKIFKILQNYIFYIFFLILYIFINN